MRLITGNLGKNGRGGDGRSGVGASNEFKTTSSYSHTQLVTLIGDLDKLEQNKEAKREYLAVLSQVDDFMDKSK